MDRPEILDKAKECVCGQREQDYGSPEDNFQTIANLWTAYKGASFTAVDVAMMMALLKIARIQSGTATDDSFVDLAGYAACGGEIAAKGRRSAITVEHKKMPIDYIEAVNDGKVTPEEVMMDVFQDHYKEPLTEHEFTSMLTAGLAGKPIDTPLDESVNYLLDEILSTEKEENK